MHLAIRGNINAAVGDATNHTGCQFSSEGTSRCQCGRQDVPKYSPPVSSGGVTKYLVSFLFGGSVKTLHKKRGDAIQKETTRFKGYNPISLWLKKKNSIVSSEIDPELKS